MPAWTLKWTLKDDDDELERNNVSSTHLLYTTVNTTGVKIKCLGPPEQSRG